MTQLRLRDVTVAAGARLVLDAISLDIASGSLCALVGASGAGKTTLLRAVAGLVPLRAGSVTLDGRPVEHRPPHRRDVAMCFQEPRLFPSMSVVENVAYARRIRGERRTARRDVAHDLLAEVGLAHRAGEPVTGLSGGEQQRVALARALCADPRVLLLDEPLGAVDAPRRGELRELIREIQARRAVTTILVTHDLADATAVGDRVAVVEAGRLVQHDRPDVVIRRPATPDVARLTGNPNLLWEPAGADHATPWTIRPEHVRLADQGIPVRVVAAEHRVTHVRLRLHGPLGELEALVDADAAPPVGRHVHVDLPTEHVWRFTPPRDGPLPDPGPGDDAGVTGPLHVTDLRGR